MLGILAGVYCAWPIWRAGFPLEIDVNEAWNAYHADAASGSRPLYPDADALITNNYPPLSFYWVALVSKLGLDALYVGRALSILAVAAISASAAVCIRGLGASRISAVVGGLWFLATTARFFDGYVGMNDPHLPATGLMIVALVWFLARHRRERSVEPAVLLMVIAGFYKHSLVATPAAALLWLTSLHWRLGLRATLVGIGAAGFGLALCVFAFGPSFADQLLSPRYYSVVRSLHLLGRLQWIAPALLLCLIWSWRASGTESNRFVRIYIGVAFAAFFLQSGGDGVDDNAQFELAVATALGLGLAFDTASQIFGLDESKVDRARAAILAALIARLLLSTRLEPYLVLASPEYRNLFPANAEIAKQETQRIRAIPGAVYCTISIVCRFAGKPFVLDRFAMEQRVKIGRMTHSEPRCPFALRGDPHRGSRFPRVGNILAAKVSRPVATMVRAESLRSDGSRSSIKRPGREVPWRAPGEPGRRPGRSGSQRE